MKKPYTGPQFSIIKCPTYQDLKHKPSLHEFLHYGTGGVIDLNFGSTTEEAQI